MNVRVRIIGKFDKIGEVEVENKVVSVPGVVPIRWTIKVLWFKVTIVGRAEITEA